MFLHGSSFQMGSSKDLLNYSARPKTINVYSPPHECKFIRWNITEKIFEMPLLLL